MIQKLRRRKKLHILSELCVVQIELKVLLFSSGLRTECQFLWMSISPPVKEGIELGKDVHSKEIS